MKHILFILLIGLLHTTLVKGQGLTCSAIAFTCIPSDTTALKWHGRPGECKAIRQGRRLMIIGGSAMFVGGGLLAISNIPGVNSPNNGGGFAVLVWGGLLLFGGGELVLAGTGEFIGGKIHDRRNRNRYSIIGSGNQMGIAYNF